MFDIGDKIFYPMQGVGVIQGIEEKDFLGKIQPYYIIKILSNNMKVMIPSNRATDSNIRLISDPSKLEKTLSSFDGKESVLDESLSSRQRYQINMDKVKTGSLKEATEVFYELTQLNNEKPLGTNEKQMLSNTRKLLIDEMMFVKNISENEADELLDSIIS